MERGATAEQGGDDGFHDDSAWSHFKIVCQCNLKRGILKSPESGANWPDNGENSDGRRFSEC
jgi:hypothetical protein